MSATARPDWIAEGTKVVAYVDTPFVSRRSARITTITKVNAKSFRIEGSDLLYRIEDLTVADTGRSSDAKRVAPVDSDTGRSEIAAQVARNRNRRAENAAFDWSRNRTRETTLAAIGALQASLANYPEES